MRPRYGAVMRIHVVRGGPMLVDAITVDVLRRVEDGYDVAPLDDAEAHAICRCGASTTMPLCDKRPPYRCFDEEPHDGPTPAPFRWDVPDPAGPPAVALKPDGPVRVAGPEPVTYDDEAVTGRDRLSICRCGASRTQPLCDGSHKVVGFRG
jgi:CDGSH-type Zn-finger protein